MQTQRAWALAILIGLTAGCGRAGTGAPTPRLPDTAPPAGYAHVALRVVAFDGPTATMAGRPLTMTVSVALPNSCTQHDVTVAAVDDAGGRVVIASRGVEEQDAICTQILTFKPVEVTFTPGRTGTYLLVAAEGDASSAIEVR